MTVRRFIRFHKVEDQFIEVAEGSNRIADTLVRVFSTERKDLARYFN